MNATQNHKTNVPTRKDFEQVCIWPGTSIREDETRDFIKFFKDSMNTRVQFLETIITKPSICKHGTLIPGTGGREDIFFAVHKEDIAKFAIPRLRLGIRWVEDVLGAWNNYDDNPIYPPRVKGYMSWDNPELTQRVTVGREGVIKKIMGYEQ